MTTEPTVNLDQVLTNHRDAIAELYRQMACMVRMIQALSDRLDAQRAAIQVLHDQQNKMVN